MLQSLSRPRQCWDNAVAESFFASLKLECIYRQAWPTRTRARRAVFDYIEVFFNRRRLRSALGYMTPTAYENKIRNTNAFTRHNHNVRRTGSTPVGSRNHSGVPSFDASQPAARARRTRIVRYGDRPRTNYSRSWSNCRCTA
jgi:hypothetical protein